GGPGVAVVENDRGGGEEGPDQKVPHHPARSGEPEDAVALLRVEVEVPPLELLEQDAAVPVDDRLGEAGRPGGVEDPEGVIEGDAVEGELGARAEVGELYPCHRLGDFRVFPQPGEIRRGAQVREDDDPLE